MTDPTAPIQHQGKPDIVALVKNANNEPPDTFPIVPCQRDAALPLTIPPPRNPTEKEQIQTEEIDNRAPTPIINE